MSFAAIIAFIQSILKAIGFIKDVMPSESEKEESDKAELDRKVKESDETSRP